MTQHENPSRLVRSEARHYVHEIQRVTGGRHVLKGIRPKDRCQRLQALKHPLELPRMTLRTGRPRAERHLHPDELEGRFTVERRASGRGSGGHTGIDAPVENEQKRDESESCRHGGYMVHSGPTKDPISQAQRPAP